MLLFKRAVWEGKRKTTQRSTDMNTKAEQRNEIMVEKRDRERGGDQQEMSDPAEKLLRSC